MPDQRTPAVPAAADALLSIGDLAQASGIGIEAIRAWERRYGRPQAVRLPSGHRRYRPEHVVWLRRVAEALALGHRPGAVVALPEEELDALLAQAQPAAAGGRSAPRWLSLVRRYDGKRILAALRESWTARGAVEFIEEQLTPLLSAVGRAWADGELQVRHEHWLTELLEDFLRTLRRRYAGKARGPVVVLATLPGEQHGLGLQMGALLCAVHGLRVRLLGVDTPLEEIVSMADETRASLVAISVSLATGGVETDRVLSDLRQALPDRVQLVVGGAGARGVRRGPRGVRYLASFGAFDALLRELPDARGAK